jgi:hypothetical protein
MSAIGPKRTSLAALHMSAFGGKADIIPMRPRVSDTGRGRAQAGRVEFLLPGPSPTNGASRPTVVSSLAADCRSVVVAEGSIGTGIGSGIGRASIGWLCRTGIYRRLRFAPIGRLRFAPIGRQWITVSPEAHSPESILSVGRSGGLQVLRHADRSAGARTGCAPCRQGLRLSQLRATGSNLW